MRILLATFAFVISAPLLFLGLANTYVFVRENRAIAGELGFDEFLMIWPFLATLAGILLLGFVFLAAGIAVLAIKPHVKHQPDT